MQAGSRLHTASPHPTRDFLRPGTTRNENPFTSFHKGVRVASGPTRFPLSRHRRVGAQGWVVSHCPRLCSRVRRRCASSSRHRGLATLPGAACASFLLQGEENWSTRHLRKGDRQSAVAPSLELLQAHGCLNCAKFRRTNAVKFSTSHLKSLTVQALLVHRSIKRLREGTDVGAQVELVWL